MRDCQLIRGKNNSINALLQHQSVSLMKLWNRSMKASLCHIYKQGSKKKDCSTIKVE